MNNVPGIVPDAHGKFAMGTLNLHRCLRSGTAGSVPTAKNLTTEGQYAYNYVDDVFYVRRGDKILKYKYDSMEDIKSGEEDVVVR